MQMMPSLQVKQKQALVMTPQLQQAIKLLQMTNLDICNFLQEQALENPFIEVEHGTDHTPAADLAPTATALAEAESAAAVKRTMEQGQGHSHMLTDIYQFGVYTGGSLREIRRQWMQRGLGVRAVWGLDSFEGLAPVSDVFDHKTWTPGAFSASSAAVRSFSCRLASSTSLTGFLLRRRGFGGWAGGGCAAASCSLRRISRSWARFSRSWAMR